jgi:ATP-dependent DNA helicase RecG
LRGPGDYFGVRQSGFPDLKVARLDDAILVESARAAAHKLLQGDPNLDKPEHAPLRQHLHTFVERVGEPS